jgi:hypothetical protein
MKNVRKIDSVEGAKRRKGRRYWNEKEREGSIWISTKCHAVLS